MKSRTDTILRVARMRFACRRAIAVFSLTAFAAVSNAAAAEALQFNVPYRCPDHTTNTILRCESKGRGQVCVWREERDGKLAIERFSSRTQIDVWLKLCRIQAAPRQPTRAGGAVSSSAAR